MRLESQPELRRASGSAVSTVHFGTEGLAVTVVAAPVSSGTAPTDLLVSPRASLTGGAPSRSDTAWRPPVAVDKYRIVRFIGSGAMGQVYLAHDADLERLVAVKFICGIDPAPAAKDRFIVEARAAARLQHPNVVTVYRVAEHEGRPYLVTEFVQGKRLDEIPKPASCARVLELGIGLASGLAAAHRKAVLHRDIKPSNAIVADGGEVKLLDFGLAKLLDGSTSPLTRSASSAPLEARVASAGPPSALCGTTLTSPGAEPAGVASRTLSLEPRPRPLTDAGALMGTPDYMAPEIWGGQEATTRSDVYSLGVLLFELCAGHTPHRDVARTSLSHTVQHCDAPLLAALCPAVNAKLAAVIHRCLRRDPLERYASGDELHAALKQIERASGLPEGNPYRGIHAFEAEHRGVFSGRSAESGTVLARLRSEPLVIVAGDSGVGKSSLCRAGVLPAVQDGSFGDDRAWSVVRLVPGRSPLPALAAALAPRLGLSEDAVVEELRAQPAALALALSGRLGRHAGVVLFVDQLEELVTVSDLEGAATVATALGHLTKGIPGVRLLMTVRSDFLARIADLPGLGDAIARALYLLKPLGPEGIRQAILDPAEAAGVAFEAEALQTLVASTSQAEGGLPLLQFALAELWEARDQGARSISREALDRIGGVAGALTRSADAVLLRMTAVQLGIARRILTLLVSPQGALVRRCEDDLVAGDPAAPAVLQALVAGRLLVTRDAGQGAIYALAQEALLKSWTTLRRWLDEQADSRDVRVRLATAAAVWDQRGRVHAALWSARMLADVDVVDPDDLAERERAFVAASREGVWRSQNAWRLGKAFLLLLAVILPAVAFGLRTHGRHQVDHRVAALLDEANDSLAAARRDEEALEALAPHEPIASLRLVDDEDDAYVRASQALERALMIDTGSAEVQARLGDVLCARALLADRQHHVRQRDELLQRLALYDVEGIRRRRWEKASRGADPARPAAPRP